MRPGHLLPLVLLAACFGESAPDPALPDDDDSAVDEPACDPPCDPGSELCVDGACLCADGFHDDGRDLGVCVPDGTCADGFGVPEGELDCAPIEDFCPDETCHLLVGWDGECLYEVTDDLTPCEGSSTDPCDDEFVCQAGACVPAPRTCSELRPLLFVHGVNGSSADFDALAARLVADGWPMEFLFFFDAEDPSWGCNMDNAAVIDALVDQVMATTCEPRIDLVAHSMGTLSSRWFVKFLGGAELVNVYATIGGMHHGLLSPCFAPDFLGVCVWQEICEWGDMVTELNEPPATPGELAWVSIYGTADETIPNDSSHLDGAENIVIEGATHVGLWTTTRPTPSWCGSWSTRAGDRGLPAAGRTSGSWNAGPRVLAMTRSVRTRESDQGVGGCLFPISTRLTSVDQAGSEVACFLFQAPERHRAGPDDRRAGDGSTC